MEILAGGIQFTMCEGFLANQRTLTIPRPIGGVNTILYDTRKHR